MAQNSPKLQSITGSLGAPESSDGGQPPMDSAMNARITGLEREIGGLKRVQDITVAAVIGVGAILIVLCAYMLTRIDQVNDRVSELPDKISSDLRDISKTLAESITAAKQQAPQVIIMPAPQSQPVTPQK